MDALYAGYLVFSINKINYVDNTQNMFVKEKVSVEYF